MPDISTEVAFQKGSPLAVGLTSVFAEVFRFKSELPNDGNLNKTVLEHVAKVTIPAMSKVISSMTGIEIKEVQLASSPSLNFGAMMFLDENPAEAIRILNTVTGEFAKAGKMATLIKANEMECLTCEQLTKLMNSFDSKISAYRKNPDMPDHIDVAMIILFDPYTAFLAKETVHPNAPQMEPQEITAIILHEIGHMISVLEMAAETYYMNDIIKRTTEYFGDHAPASEVAKYISDTLLTHEEELPKGFMEKLSEGLKNRSTIFGNVIRSVLNLLSVFGVVLIPLSIIGRCFGGVFDKIQYSKLNMPVKTSDLYGYLNQKKQAENYADNFVVRHGMGSYLLSSLQKFDDMLSHSTALVKRGKMTPSLQWSLAKFPTYVSAILFGNASNKIDEHGTYTQRAENMLEETLKVFRNDLPPDVLAYYLNEYKTCKLLLARKPNTVRWKDAFEKFYKFVEYVMATPIALFGNARFDQEYETLVQHVNNLKNNRLYYFKAVFQNYLNNH